MRCYTLTSLQALSLLHFAALCDDAAAVRMLISAGVDMNEADNLIVSITGNTQTGMQHTNYHSMQLHHLQGAKRPVAFSTNMLTMPLWQHSF